MTKIHQVTKVSFENDHLILEVDNNLYSFPLKVISSSLAKATATERNIYQISPSGYGIHWLLIDEDLSINTLLTLAKQNNYQLSVKLMEMSNTQKKEYEQYKSRL